MRKIILPLSLAFVLTNSTSAQSTATKKVLLEEFTTTLCGMCPPKSHDINDWHDNNGQKSVLMTHHAGFGVDQMTTTEATTVCNVFSPSTFGFAPAIMIDRDVYPWVDSVPYMPVNGFDTIATRISNNTADVAINLQGTYNSTTRLLSVTATATFVNAVTTGNLRLTIYLVEDSVIGSGSGYDQKCYDGTFANTYYSGQWNSTTYYISGYPHRMVERKSLTGGTWGASGIIPNSPVVGTPYTTSTTYTVPSTNNDSRLYLVAYVAYYGTTKQDREILNANDIKVSSSFSTTTSVEQENNLVQINSIYPNPSNNFINLAFTSVNGGATSVSVVDVTGRTVFADEQTQDLAPGKYDRFIDVTNLDAGIYFLILKRGEATTAQKFIIER